MNLPHRKIGLVLLLLFSTLTLSAQDLQFVPSITVQDQLVSDTSIVLDEIVAQRFGVIAIRADDGEGNPGGLLGFSLLRPGVNPDIRVELQMINITPQLHAVLHLDTEPFGEFQYDSNPENDPPVTVDDNIVTVAFDVAVISAHDQFVDPENFNRVVVDTAAISSESKAWVVAHSDDDGTLGEVLGHTFLEQGTSQNIPILLQGNVTDQIHIALHLDSGERERFEYPSSTVDTPFSINGEIPVTTISTVPAVHANDQLVIGSDLTRNANETVPFVTENVLSDGAGWLVIHADDGSGNAGDVIGVAPVQDGYNHNVIVEVTQAEVTPILFSMLHTDTGESQVYEFGDVPDTDLPATYNSEILVTSARVLPSINDVSISENSLSAGSILIDTAGWLVVYAVDDDGITSNILTHAPLHAGLNKITNLALPDSTTDTLYLMLHYDTRPPGIFSFQSDDGSDLPVVFSGEPVAITVLLDE